MRRNTRRFRRAEQPGQCAEQFGIAIQALKGLSPIIKYWPTRYLSLLVTGSAFDLVAVVLVDAEDLIPILKEHLDAPRIEMPAGTVTQIGLCALDRPGLLVWPFRRQRVENIGYSDNPSNSGMASPVDPRDS